MPLTAREVADYFLACGGEDESVTNLKLQKLLYYAQGFALALSDDGQPLFEERVFAWTHGPVVAEVYYEFKQHGAQGIPPPADFDRAAFDGGVAALLDDVWTAYGQFSAWRLREMSHNEPPWHDTKLGDEITHAALMDYFRTRIQ